jgi:hypothetical protein
MWKTLVELDLHTVTMDTRNKKSPTVSGKMRSTSQGENVEEFRLFIGYWAAVDTVAAGLTGVS